MWAFCSLTWWKKSDYPEETTDLGQAIITLLHAGYRIRAVAWKSEGLNPALSRPLIIIWLRFLQTKQSFTFASWVYLLSLIRFLRPGAVARSETCPLGMKAAPSSIPTSGTFFRGDLAMKTFLRPFSLFRWFKKSSCQLLAKEWALSTGKLPRRLAQEQGG